MFVFITEDSVVNPETGLTEMLPREKRITQKGAGLCYEDEQGQWVPAAPKWIAAGAEFSVTDAAYGLVAGANAADGLAYSIGGATLSLAPRGLFFTDGTREAELFHVAPAVAGTVATTSERLEFAGALGPEVVVKTPAP